MSRRRTNVACIENQKARKSMFTRKINGLMKKAYELTMLSDTRASLIIRNLEDNQCVVWPSTEEANALIDNFYSLPDHVREMKAVDPKSLIKTNIQKTEKKLANYRKVLAEYEMEHLMFELQLGRKLSDLSQTEVDNLISYSEKKIMCSRAQLGFNEQFHTGVTEAIPRASNVASGWVKNIGFNPLESGSTYYLDQWVYDDDQKVQNHCGRETHSPTTVTGFDLNLEPSDVDEDIETYKGEISKTGGKADGTDDAE